MDLQVEAKLVEEQLAAMAVPNWDRLDLEVMAEERLEPLELGMKALPGPVWRVAAN